MSVDLVAAGLFDRQGRLRQFLELIAAMRDLTGSITDPEGLRAVVALVLKFGELLGLDATWIDRLRGVLENEATFELVLSLVRFAASWMGRVDGDAHDTVRAAATTLSTVEASAIVEWLPIVLWLLETWWRLRGNR